MWLPSPLATNTGSAPTDRHARTGELTPPGMTCFARSKIDWLRDMRATLALLLRRDDTGQRVRRVLVRCAVDDGLLAGRKLRDRRRDGLHLIGAAGIRIDVRAIVVLFDQAVEDRRELRDGGPVVRLLLEAAHDRAIEIARQRDA